MSTSWGTGSDVEDQALAARHAAADAEECLAGIDPELPGLPTTSELCPPF